MEPEQIPPTPPAPSAPPSPPKSRRRFIPGFWGWMVLVFVLLVLAGLAMPLFCAKSAMGSQTKVLAQAKQIGLALKMFAADNEGDYPRAGLADMLGADPKNSNAAFAVLLPQYLVNESLFGNEHSAYQTRPPDNVYDNPYTGHPDKTLEPGENVYAYMAGLTEKSAPGSPLVFDGTDGTGHYTTDSKKRGGVWGGGKAIIVHLDNSAAVETLAGPDNARYIRRHGEDNPKEDKGNALDPAGLGPNARLLDPAFNR